MTKNYIIPPASYRIIGDNAMLGIILLPKLTITKML